MMSRQRRLAAEYENFLGRYDKPCTFYDYMKTTRETRPLIFLTRNLSYWQKNSSQNQESSSKPRRCFNVDEMLGTTLSSGGPIHKHQQPCDDNPTKIKIDAEEKEDDPFIQYRFYITYEDNGSRTYDPMFWPASECPFCELRCPLVFTLLQHLNCCHPLMKFYYGVQGEKNSVIQVHLNKGNPLNLEDIVKKMRSEKYDWTIRRPELTATELITWKGFSKPSPSLRQFWEPVLVAGKRRSRGKGKMIRPYTKGHIRQYYNRSLLLPYPSGDLEDNIPEEDLNCVLINRDIFKLEDLCDEEKAVAITWNEFLFGVNPIGDCHIPAACHVFVQEFGRRLMKAGLYHYVVLHLLNLCELGLLTSEQLHQLCCLLRDQADGTSVRDASFDHQSEVPLSLNTFKLVPDNNYEINQSQNLRERHLRKRMEAKFTQDCSNVVGLELNGNDKKAKKRDADFNKAVIKKIRSVRTAPGTRARGVDVPRQTVYAINRKSSHVEPRGSAQAAKVTNTKSQLQIKKTGLPKKRRVGSKQHRVVTVFDRKKKKAKRTSRKSKTNLMVTRKIKAEVKEAIVELKTEVMDEDDPKLSWEPSLSDDCMSIKQESINGDEEWVDALMYSNDVSTTEQFDTVQEDHPTYIANEEIDDESETEMRDSPVEASTSEYVPEVNWYSHFTNWLGTHSYDNQSN